MKGSVRRPGRKRPSVGHAATMRAVADLLPSARNPRMHNAEHIEQISASIKQFGFTMPVLIDERGELLAGHGRVLAAKRLGMSQVPAIVATGWTDAQKRAYRIADNRLTEAGTWDELLLKEELAELAGEFPVEALGFNPSALDSLLVQDSMIQVEEIETGPVQDRFWIVVKGPLPEQAAAFDRLKGVMRDLGDVTVETGPVQDRFWIVVKGPLPQQAAAFDRLKGVMRDLGDVTVEAGTVLDGEAP
jgi:hypothetical protein